MRPRHSSWKLTLVFVSILVMSWLSVLPLGIALGDEHRLDRTPLDLLILVDASDSMDDLDEKELATDVIDWVLDSALDSMSSIVPADTKSRVSVICFNSEGGQLHLTWMIPFRPLVGLPRKRIPFYCTRDHGTDFVRLLRDIPRQFAKEPRPENQKVVFLITDGHPSFTGESVHEEDQENLDYLRNNVAPAIKELEAPVELHIIGVGDTKFVESFWKQYDFIWVKSSDYGAYLFSVGMEFQSSLNAGIISEDLRQGFVVKGYLLSQSATVKVKGENREWVITDKETLREYTVVMEESTLTIYDRVKVEESVNQLFGAVPLLSPTVMPTSSPLPSPSFTPLSSPSPSVAVSPSPSPSVALSPSPSPSPLATWTPLPSPTWTPPATVSPTPTITGIGVVTPGKDRLPSWIFGLLVGAIGGALISHLISYLYRRRGEREQVKDRAEEHEAELGRALTSYNYELAGEIIAKAEDDVGRGKASEMFITTIKTALDRDNDLREEQGIGPFPVQLKHRVHEHLTEIEKTPGSMYDRPGAILVNLELGAIGAPDKPREEMLRCVEDLRKKLYIKEDIKEVTWVLKRYALRIQDEALKSRVIGRIVERSETLAFEAYDPAKNAIKIAVTGILNDDNIKDSDKWQRVGELMWKSERRTPALLHGIAEAFYEARCYDNQALQDILSLANAWPLRVSGEERELQFLPLNRIFSHVSTCAAKQDDLLMRDLSRGYSELCVDIAYQSANVWSTINNIRDALYHTRASQLTLSAQVLALYNLYHKLDPDELKAGQQAIEFLEQDKTLVREYPGSESILGALELLANDIRVASNLETLESIREKLAELPFERELVLTMVTNLAKKVTSST